MIAGLLIPERPVGNMYFAGFSHNVIFCTVGLCNDLKMGEYRKYPIYLRLPPIYLKAHEDIRMSLITNLAIVKVPPRVMFLTQVYGSILGGFVNYAVMISIVNGSNFFFFFFFF